jgi:hypothetical protein
MVLMVEPPPSNPPLGYSQCPHPPKALPPSAEDEAGAEGSTEKVEPSSNTKSPQSQHTIKWAHITSPSSEVHADAPFIASATLGPYLSPQLPLEPWPLDVTTQSTLPLSATS